MSIFLNHFNEECGKHERFPKIGYCNARIASLSVVAALSAALFITGALCVVLEQSTLAESSDEIIVIKGSQPVAANSSGGVFRYRDEAGRVHYTTSADKVPAKFRSQVAEPVALPKINKLNYRFATPPEWKSADADGSSDRAAKYGEKGVQIYMTSWCGHCKTLEVELKRLGVPFTKHNIETELSAKKKYEALGGAGVPLTTVNGKVIRGGPAQIQAALRKHG